jgi:hypothetical protein
MSDSQYGVRVATNKAGNAYIAGLYGPKGVAQKLKAMGLERNEFQKWVNQAAIIVGRRATYLAPVDSGKLAASIRGYAGKKITQNNAPARYLFGGVVIAQPKSETGDKSYAKAVSFGRYYKQSSLGLRIGARLIGDSRGVRQNAIRTQGNPYMRKARDQTRYNVVKMWNKEIGRWIEKNGFETTGFGG